MPVIFWDRVPLPRLKTYLMGSLLALSGCVYFAIQIITDGSWSYDDDTKSSAFKDRLNITNSSADATGRSLGQWVYQIFFVMIREPICVWTMINMAFCWLILMGRCIQKLVFGELRVSEQQHLKDKFWNFVFYKFIFVFGVINVQYIDEVLLWCSWFALLGFLHLLSLLGKDRFEYLSFSPTTPVWNHVKLLCLLVCIFALSGFMLLVAVFVGFFGGLNTFAFMSAEVVLLSIRTLHVILRYGVHLYDMRQEGATGTGPRLWESRGLVAYYAELAFELSALTIDFVHHVHMLLWSNIFLSMASLVICMQLRYLFHELQRRYRKHRNYLLVRDHLEQHYPMATGAELLQNGDNCAICWEKMEAARKLPCAHLFHNTCLQSWLEQDTSCPTCRLALSIQSAQEGRAEQTELLQAEEVPAAHRQLNHFFHFDGSRYVSWLPSFSVEVSHAHLLRSPDHAPAPNSQLDAMGRQVQQLFPHLPLGPVVEDLRITRSVEMTIENVLDGRLVVPPAMFRSPEPPPRPQTRRPTSSSSSSSAASSALADDFSIIESDASGAGSRFSKSSSERERILQRRKEQLIQAARRRYLEKQQQKDVSTSES